MQNLKKTDLWFEKWHEEFGKFSPEHLKVSKLRLWWDSFVQSRKCMSLKFMCHDNEEWHDMRNLMNFDLSTRKSKKFALQLAPLTKVYYILWAEEELCLMALKILKENWLVLSKMTWKIWQICIGWNSTFNKTFYTFLTKSFFLKV